MTSNRNADQRNANVPGRLPLGRYVALACHLEVAAPKPGNVSRVADFASTTLQDFLISGEVVSACLERAEEHSVGELILQAVTATQTWVGQNTNLGLILLLAPLAKAVAGSSGPVTTAEVRQVLRALTPRDARDVFQAIRLAAPGGLGQVAELDIRTAEPTELLPAMQLAAPRDLVAAQYVTDFETVFHEIVPSLLQGTRRGWALADAVVFAHVQTMQNHPDSLIGRKCGPAVASESSRRAADVLRHAPPHSPSYRQALVEFDKWLRGDGNRRNPGTTADLLGAALFVCLVNHELLLPLR